jgi:phospholipase C
MRVYWRDVTLAAAGVLVTVLLAACSSRPGHIEPMAGGPGGGYVVPAGIHKIKHVVIVMQENRSFDSYFGTYPGAAGIPMRNGKPAVCVPKPGEGCIRPYHLTSDINSGGPHGVADAVADVDGGKMDGFIRQRFVGRATCKPPGRPACRIRGRPDVMGYHTAAEIPNYWAYARDFVLDDHMFEPVRSWSLAEHLDMVSAWSAKCRTGWPMSCSNNIWPYKLPEFDQAVQEELATGRTTIDLAWTDITWLLHAHHVSWAYYVEKGVEPDCQNDSEITCSPVRQSAGTPGMWNPLPLFGDVHADHQLGNIQGLSGYFAAAKAGTLPAVSWVTPSGRDSEHPPASVHQGQAYATAVINAAMKSPDWDSTAIFLAWDDWGGFYDSAVPPTVDRNGYGLRVPAITISAYARKGYIDHQVLTSDAYLKFIEDDFLGGARLNPRTDGRPDRRPDVRENEPVLGTLTADFDFRQQPRPPLLLPTNPPTDSPSIPAHFAGRRPCLGCTSQDPSSRPLLAARPGLGAADVMLAHRTGSRAQVRYGLRAIFALLPPGASISRGARSRTVPGRMHEHEPDSNPQPPHGRQMTGVTEQPSRPRTVQHRPLQLAGLLPQAGRALPQPPGRALFPVGVIRECHRGAHGGIQQRLGRQVGRRDIAAGCGLRKKVGQITHDVVLGVAQARGEVL